MRLLIAFFAVALSGAAHGQLLKCVSKDGKVSYARDCPAGTTEQKTGIRDAAAGGAAPATPPAQKTLSEREAESRLRSIDQQKDQQDDEKKAAAAEIKGRNCQLAKTYVSELEGGTRITRTDPATLERVFLEDNEREAELATARAKVAQDCS